MGRRSVVKRSMIFLTLLLVLCMGSMPVQAASKKDKALAAYSAALEKKFFNTVDGEEKVRAASFALIHMNRDQVPELLVKCHLGGGWGGTKGYLVYTYKGGTVQRLGVINGGETVTELYYYKKARILRESWVRWDRDIRNFRKIKDGKLWVTVGRSKLLAWSNHDKVLKTNYYADGKFVSRAKHNALVKKLVGSEKGVNVEKFLKENTAANRRKLKPSQPSLRLNKSSAVLNLKKKKSITLKASLKNMTGKVKWSSSNPQIAVVNSSGKVTAKKAGKTTIFAKAGGKSVKCRITVKKGKTGKKEEKPKKAASGYRPVTNKREKRGSYHMWIDTKRCLHIRKGSSGKDTAKIKNCDGAVSNGKTIYYVTKMGNIQKVTKYSVGSGAKEVIMHFKDVDRIVGAYKNRLIFETIDPYPLLYIYDMNSDELNQTRYYGEYINTYKNYIIYKGTTGAVNSVNVGIYNEKTNKGKNITEGCWHFVQDDKYLYYTEELGVISTKFGLCYKVRVCRYTMTTGKKEVLSQPVIFAPYKKDEFTNRKFTYYDHHHIEHTIHF